MHCTKNKAIKILSVLVVFCFSVISFSGCAYVTKGYQLYPLGVSVKTNSVKSIYVQSAVDKRADNITTTMFYGKEKPTKYLTRYQNMYFFVEDPQVQTASEFFTAAVQNDLRDAGFRIANSKSSADYVMALQLNRLDGYKEMPILSVILGVLTFGILAKHDVVTVADFNAYVTDAKTNQKVFSKNYKSEELIEQYYYDVYSYNTDYYLTRQIKMSVKKLLSDAIKAVR